MSQEQPTEHLPARVAGYIDFVVRKMRYRRRVRQEVRRELAAHFADALAECTDEEERQALGDKLIQEFGDAKMLAILIRRGKKRCRPLWKKAIIRSLQGAGILILLMGLRVAHLSLGNPSVKVNYIEWFNEQVRNGRDEALNGKNDLDRAVELRTNEWPDFMDESEDYWNDAPSEQKRKAMRKFFEENADSLAALRAAAAKPYFWLEYDGDPVLEEGGPYKSILPFRTGYRGMGSILYKGIMWRAYDGDVAGALDDSVLLQRLGRHLQGKGTLIEQLTGTSVEHLSWRATTMIVARADVPREVLLRVQHTLEEASAEETPLISLLGDKVFWYDYVQRTFTDDGKGGGRMLPKGLPLVLSGWQDAVRGFLVGYPDRRETLEMIEQYFQGGEETIAKTPWQLHQESPRTDRKDSELRGSMLLDLLVPAYDRVVLHHT